jgi:hypothetical protein
MLERLLGIKTLEDTEPVELEEVPMTMAPRMPEEYDDHSNFDYLNDSETVLDMEDEGGV